MTTNGIRIVHWDNILVTPHDGTEDGCSNQIEGNPFHSLNLFSIKFGSIQRNASFSWLHRHSIVCPDKRKAQYPQPAPPIQSITAHLGYRKYEGVWLG